MMKKKLTVMIGVTAAASMLLFGCSGLPMLPKNFGSSQDGEDVYAAEDSDLQEEYSLEEELESGMEGMGPDEGMQGSGFDDAFAWLPASAQRKASETVPNELVRAAIIDEYMIPEEEWEATRYYYNYVDLDDDGNNEIFVLAAGPSVSGSGGFSALLMEEGGEVLQTFTLVNPPVLVTDEIINGYRELALVRSGGGAETEVVLLSYGNGAYETVSETETVIDPNILSGTAILCNDLAADLESGNFLTLTD